MRDDYKSASEKHFEMSDEQVFFNQKSRNIQRVTSEQRPYSFSENLFFHLDA